MKLNETTLKKLKDETIQFDELNDDYFILDNWFKPEHQENICKLLSNNICTFDEILKKYKGIQNKHKNQAFQKLISDIWFFDSLIRRQFLIHADLKSIWDKIESKGELEALVINDMLLIYMLKINIISFQQLIDKYKNTDHLHVIFVNPSTFKNLLNYDLFFDADAKYLLNKIETAEDATNFCKNRTLLKHLLKNFKLNVKSIKKLDKIIQNIHWCKDQNIHSLFDLIEFFATHYRDIQNEVQLRKDSEIDRELLKFIVMNRCVYKFKAKQRSKLIETLKNDKTASSRFDELMNNNIENDFDFNSLITYLKKKERKNLLNF